MEAQPAAVPVVDGTTANDDVPTISRNQLPALGCPWKDTHLRKLIKDGKFPAPHRPSERIRRWTPRQIREFHAQKSAGA